MERLPLVVALNTMAKELIDRIELIHVAIVESILYVETQTIVFLRHTIESFMNRLGGCPSM